MPGFADLAQRQGVGGALGANAATFVQGTTWREVIGDFYDDEGDLIDLSTTTGACEVLDPSGAVVATFTYTGYSDGTLKVECDESLTGDLVPSGRDRRLCGWRLIVTHPTVDDVVCFWNTGDSPFVIRAN